MVSISPTITTPSNLITYAQSLATGDPSRTFVENMVANSDLLNAMITMPADRGKKAFLDIGSLPAVGFRGLNEAGGQALGDFNPREEDTFFIDEYINTDRGLIDRLGPDGKYKQEKLKSIALSQYASQNIVKGDTSSNPRTPTGMQGRCNTVGVNLINNSAASGGAALSLANLDQLYWLVNGKTHWVFPRGLMPFVDIAARSASLVNQTFSTDTDNLGRNITKYKGLPILYGYDPDDSPDLLPFTEVASGGGGAVTSSIYCVNLSSNGFYMIEQTPLQVLPEGPIPGTPFDSLHIKWDWGLVREHPRAIARLSSITAATIV